MAIYTHRGIDFEWQGGLFVYRVGMFTPLPLKLNNGSPSWRLARNIWLSVKQLKIIISEKNKNEKKRITREKSF